MHRYQKQVTSIFLIRSSFDMCRISKQAHAILPEHSHIHVNLVSPMKTKKKKKKNQKKRCFRRITTLALYLIQIAAQCFQSRIVTVLTGRTLEWMVTTLGYAAFM